MKKEGWQRKWRRLMFETGLFLPWRIDDIQSMTKYDEAAGLSPEESVSGWIEQTKEVQHADKIGG